VAVCADVGSTFTKVAVVGLDGGALLGTAERRTTVDTDVLHGLDAVVAELERVAGPAGDVLACSSAGGGLRLAVVGYERAVTAEAGQRVGLSAGAKVVHVAAGLLDTAGLQALRASRPDVVLLVGGTDGGNADVLLQNASRLAGARVAVPVVVAGNAAARDEAVRRLESTRRRVVASENVLPRIGVLEPAPARAAIREVFLRHVIGGKLLSRGPRVAGLVRGATPDVVLAGVEVLADGAPAVPGAGDVLVVDVGGATTDVYSVITPQGEDATLRKEVVAPLWRARTVEGDLGMRWGATGIVEAARAERLVDDAEADHLQRVARHRIERPAFVPATSDDLADDVRLATLAVTVALRRHARPGSPTSAGRDLRRVRVLVGSGGLLRHADAAVREAVLRPGTTDHGGGGRVPEDPSVVVDADYVLFAAGLLAGAGAGGAAARLATSALPAASPDHLLGTIR
jgi:uncharacterized protein (TIGR01319 family)